MQKHDPVELDLFSNRNRTQGRPVMSRHLRSFLSAALVLTLVGSASAQRGKPASLLLFPEFDGRSPALIDFLTVTNTNPLEAIRVEWVFIDGDLCLEFNRTDLLTANDTLTVVSRFYNPQMQQGFAYVFAKSQATGQPVAFDHLIGTSSFFDGAGATSYVLEPLTFSSPLADGQATDVDGDGRRDLDGSEYDGVPDLIRFPRFLGNDPMNFQTDLILINLTGTVRFDATVNLLVHNDNEEIFSAQYAFACWTSTPLTDVSGVFSNSFLKVTNHDPSEILGAPQLESGWFTLDGFTAVSPRDVVEDPAIVAALVERGSLSSAVQHVGSGVQLNGDLINRSLVAPLAGDLRGTRLAPLHGVGAGQVVNAP